MNPKLLSPYVGCAGWSIPKENTGSFPEAGTHLQRYAQRFRGVEINSSFYRPHKPQTYAKWAGDVRDDFRFAVKVPKVITHEGRLKNAGEPLTRFLQEVGELGPKLGPLLVQLPPSLAFDEAIVSSFFSTLRDCFAGHVVCEPRHLTWFSPEANELLASFQVARVAADPALTPNAAKPGGWPALAYYRLHGSPRVYYSAYSNEFLTKLTNSLRSLAAAGSETWCIFDNTAGGEATGNALDVLQQWHLREK